MNHLEDYKILLLISLSLHLLGFRKKYDDCDDSRFVYSTDRLVQEYDELSTAEIEALKLAQKNIKKFHAACKPGEVFVETMSGVTCRRVYKPIDTVGLYIPGGEAPLVSTVLMLAIPAQLAGVKRIVLMTPPRGKNIIDPAIAHAAKLCGIREIYAAGGPAAIAAMTYGTQSVPRVDKIFGPGNVYVNTAKQFATSFPGGPAIDLPAGPSEVMITADDRADPEFITSDMLAQAEHDALAHVVLIARSEAFAERVGEAVRAQLSMLKNPSVAARAMENAVCLIVQSNEQALAAINQYAPEHLIITQSDADKLVPNIQNAGAIFIGAYTPEAVGDYASGANHVLPTGGCARSYGGLTVESFMRPVTIQEVSKEGIQKIGPAIERIASLEGLEAHAKSISIRLSSLQQEGKGT